VWDFQERLPEGYRWPQFTDFWFTIVTTLALGTLEHVFQYLFFDWFCSICKEKDDKEERERRSKKAV